MANWFPSRSTPVTVSIVNLFFLLQGNKLLHIFPGRERYYWFILHNRRLWYQSLIQMSKITAESWRNQHSKLQNITSLARDNNILCLNLYLWYLQSNLVALSIYAVSLEKPWCLMFCYCQLSGIQIENIQVTAAIPSMVPWEVRFAMVAAYRCQGQVKLEHRRNPLPSIITESQVFPGSWKTTG